MLYFTSRFPSPEEERLLVYYEISRGAKGIFFRAWGWPNGKPPKKELGMEVKKINGELQVLKRFLRVGEPVSLAEASEPKVEANTILSGERAIVLILINHDVETVSLETLPCSDGVSEAIDFVTPDHILDQACLYELVMKAIEALPEKNRVVVTLHYINGWSYEKISDFLAVPKSTISGRMQMAKKQIKEILNNHEITSI